MWNSPAPRRGSESELSFTAYPNTRGFGRGYSTYQARVLKIQRERGVLHIRKHSHMAFGSSDPALLFLSSLSHGTGPLITQITVLSDYRASQTQTTEQSAHCKIPMNPTTTDPAPTASPKTVPISRSAPTFDALVLSAHTAVPGAGTHHGIAGSISRSLPRSVQLTLPTALRNSYMRWAREDDGGPPPSTRSSLAATGPSSRAVGFSAARSASRPTT